MADKLKLEIKTATKLSRKPAAGVTGLLANAKFLAAIFGPDAIEKKRNTEAIETAPNQLTAGRITQYQAAKTMALADVRANVRERLVASRSAELAAQEGAAKLAAWKAAPASAVMSAAQVLSRDQAQNTPPQILNAVLRADTSKLPVFVGVSMGAQGYAVVKVNQLVARPASTEVAAKQDRAQYAQWWTAAESQAYYGLLKERFKADIMVPRPARAGS